LSSSVTAPCDNFTLLLGDREAGLVDEQHHSQILTPTLTPSPSGLHMDMNSDWDSNSATRQGVISFLGDYLIARIAGGSTQGSGSGGSGNGTRRLLGIDAQHQLNVFVQEVMLV
jgi:hypothetical protein